MIPARFQQLRDRGVRQVDRVFAEPVLIAPMVDGVRDPDLEPFQIEAPLRIGGAREGNAGGTKVKTWNVTVAAGRGQLFIDAATYDGPQIVSGWKVRALSRPGQPWFEVLHVDDRVENRLVIVLGEG